MIGSHDPVLEGRYIRLMLFASLTVATACHGPSVEQVETTAVVPVAVATAEVGPLRATIPATGGGVQGKTVRGVRAL